MHVHIRVHHGVLVWFYVGVVCGAIALANILGRNLSPAAVKWILVIGALHWLIGGILCYEWDAVRIETPHREARTDHVQGKTGKTRLVPHTERHYASEFVLPGSGKHLFHPKY